MQLLKKILPVLLFAFCHLTNSFAQSGGVEWVIHPKVMEQLGENEAVRETNIHLLKTKLESIRSYKEKVLTEWQIVEMVHQKIYHNLLNVDDAIRNGKQMYYAGKEIPEIIANVAEAGKLAVGKPYLIAYWNGIGQEITLQALQAYSDIDHLILKSKDPAVLISQTERDELLWKVSEDMNALYNLSRNMLYQFRYYNLQMAINHIVPYQGYINIDKFAVNQILQTAKF